MKILFLTPHLLSGGAERTTTYLSAYLSDQGFDVTVLCLTNDVFYDLDTKVKLKVLSIKNSTRNILYRGYLYLKRCIMIRRDIRNNRYNVIISLMPHMLRYINCYKNIKIVTSERINPEIFKDNIKVLNLRKKMYKKADGIVFQTQRAMDFYPEEIQKKGVVIHNAVGNECVYDCPKVSLRKKKITAIGRLTEQKDYPVLLRAFKAVLEKCPEYTLEIFGDGPDKDKLKQLSKELGISKSVSFMGVHGDAILQAADSACYVMNSKYEGMPNALMEAMAVGLPCVSTDCPNGPAELIVSGENGVLVPVGDERTLSEAILRMITDRDFAERCATNARKILETHGINIKAKEYMEYILKIYNEE